MRNYFLEGDRIALRVIQEKDIKKLVKWRNQEASRQTMTPRIPVTFESVLSWSSERPDKKHPTNVMFAIEIKKTRKLIGTISISGIDYVNRIATTGTSIGLKKHQGKGYGTEAKELLLRYAFHTLNLRRIYSHVYSTNKVSQRYAEKSGYMLEAVLKKERWVDGQYVDNLIFVITKKRWMRLQKK